MFNPQHKTKQINKQKTQNTHTQNRKTTTHTHTHIMPKKKKKSTTKKVTLEKESQSKPVWRVDVYKEKGTQENHNAHLKGLWLLLGKSHGGHTQLKESMRSLSHQSWQMRS